MLQRLRRLWFDTTSRLWLLPAAITAAGVALAVVLVEISAGVSAELLGRFPRLFGAGADGARGMLSTIASSMITVAGVTFSITIAAVAQTAAQYTPRVLRTFMRDRANQAVLGTFVGVFAYCLVVLRTIRGGDEGAFVPAAAVLGGFVLALLGVGVLIFFIVHISQLLQASSILDRVRRETEDAVDRLFPADLGESGTRAAGGAPGGTAPGGTADPARGPWRALGARTSGYVQSVDEDGLLAFARTRGAVVRMALGVGEFAVEGTPLAAIAPAGAPPGRPGGAGDAQGDEHALNALYVLSPYRTVTQDAAFGILQVVDIALKALSPGINDTTTAVTCVDHLAAVLARIARRQLPAAVRADADGTVRVIAAAPTFESLVGTAFDDVRRSAAENVTVLARLLDALRTVGSCTRDPARRHVLAEQVDRVAEAAARGVHAPDDRRRLAERAACVRSELAAAPTHRPDPE